MARWTSSRRSTSRPCQVVAQTKKQHRSRDFVSFLREIDERVDPTLTVHVILDNLSAHKSAAASQRWVARQPALPVPLYANLLRLAQPRRAVLWPPHRTRPQARLTFQHARAAPRRSPPTWTPTMTRASLSKWTKTARRDPREGEAVRTAHRSSPRWPQMTNDFLKKSKIKGTSSDTRLNQGGRPMNTVRRVLAEDRHASGGGGLCGRRAEYIASRGHAVGTFDSRRARRNQHHEQRAGRHNGGRPCVGATAPGRISSPMRT